MADNACCIELHSRKNNAVESAGNSPSDANPSAAAEPEVSGPRATWNLVVDVGNLLPHVAGTLLQTNKVVGNDSHGAAAQASNLGALNGATVDENNLLATSAHDSVPQGGTDDFSNGQFVLFRSNDDLLNPSAGVPPTVQAGGAGEEENEDFDAPLEDEAEESEDSDQDDYTVFTPEELLNRLAEYKQAYRTVRQYRNATEARVADFTDEYGDLQHVRDTQEEFVQVAQDECDAIKCNAEVSSLV